MNAWCLRCTATHSFVHCPVVSHSANLNIHATAGMHDQRAVRGAAMQVDGRAEDRDLNQDGRDDEREKKGRKHAYPPKSLEPTTLAQALDGECRLVQRDVMVAQNRPSVGPKSVEA